MKGLKCLLHIKFGNYLYLLISLLLYLLSLPFLRPFGIGQALTSLFFAAIFFTSIYAIGKNRRSFFMAITLTLLAIVIRVTMVINDRELNSVGLVIAAMCFAIIAISILIRVLKDKEISLNEIFGAICCYLLIGITWGFLFSAIDSANQNAFHFSEIKGINVFQKLPRFLYFSFITLTSTGFGDIHPVSLFAEFMAYLEAIIGQIYSVALIGWMVGIYASRSNQK